MHSRLMHSCSKHACIPNEIFKVGLDVEDGMMRMGQPRRVNTRPSSGYLKMSILALASFGTIFPEQQTFRALNFPYSGDLLWFAA